MLWRRLLLSNIFADLTYLFRLSSSPLTCFSSFDLRFLFLLSASVCTRLCVIFAWTRCKKQTSLRKCKKNYRKWQRFSAALGTLLAGSFIPNLKFPHHYSEPRQHLTNTAQYPWQNFKIFFPAPFQPIWTRFGCDEKKYFAQLVMEMAAPRLNHQVSKLL